MQFSSMLRSPRCSVEREARAIESTTILSMHPASRQRGSNARCEGRVSVGAGEVFVDDAPVLASEDGIEQEAFPRVILHLRGGGRGTTKEKSTDLKVGHYKNKDAGRKAAARRLCACGRRFREGARSAGNE